MLVLDEAGGGHGNQVLGIKLRVEALQVLLLLAILVVLLVVEFDSGVLIEEVVLVLLVCLATHMLQTELLHIDHAEKEGAHKLDELTVPLVLNHPLEDLDAQSEVKNNEHDQVGHTQDHERDDAGEFSVGALHIWLLRVKQANEQGLDLNE